MLRNAFRRLSSAPSKVTICASRVQAANPPSRLLPARQLIDDFLLDTNDPLWQTLSALAAKRRWTRLPFSWDHLRPWRALIASPDIADALSKATADPLPTWLVLYLVAYKVKTARDAQGPLLDLFHAVHHTTPPEHQPPLLILTAFTLARFNLLLPLRRVIDSFLATDPLPDPELHFNLLLQAICYSLDRSAENANTLLSLLRAMESRHLKLRPRTYTALLNDRFITLPLARLVHIRMVQEGFVPQAHHLEAFVRIFAKNGAMQEARQYLDIIHDAYGDAAQHRAQTAMLSGIDRKASAFTFLNSLKSSEDEESVSHSTARLPEKPRFLSYKSTAIYDHTATLNVAAKDQSTSAFDLVATFLHLPIKPNIATYTALIQGLLLRKEFRKAEIFWDKLRRSKQPLDNAALAAGLIALTRNGKPHVAFQMLERYAKRPKQSNHDCPQEPIQLTTMTMNEFLVALRRISRPDIVFRLFTHMTVLYDVSPNARTLSILLQSARMAHRMDDNLSGALRSFKLQFSSGRSRIASLSRRLFRSFRSSQRSGPSSSSPAPAPAPAASYPTSERTEAVDDVIGALGHAGQLRRYVDAFYDSQPPVAFARTVFLRAVWGLDAAQERVLHTVVPPAHAYRSHAEADPLDGSDSSSPLGLRLGLGFGSTLIGRPHVYTFTPPPLHPLLTPSHQPMYPTIVPTNANCFEYIAMLGVAEERMGEIPLVLGWMRALGVRPSEGTLGMALVFWREVGLRAPVFEWWDGKGKSDAPGRNDRVHGKNDEVAGIGEAQIGTGTESGIKVYDTHTDIDHAQDLARGPRIPPPPPPPSSSGQNEFNKLIAYITSWVGEERLPRIPALMKWQEVVRRMRASGMPRRVGKLERRVEGERVWREGRGVRRRVRRERERERMKRVGGEV